MRFKTQILAVFLLLAFCATICAADVNGLIAHWKLDEGSGSIAYDSAGDNDATVYGAMWTSGIIGGALDFNGVSDYADCGSSFASVTGSTTKTIMAWAKPDTAATGARMLTLYRRSDYYSAFSLYPRVSGGPATWTGLYATAGNGYDVVDSGVIVETGVWTQVALVQNGADVHIYINGELKNSASNAAAPVISNPPDATIGAYKWYSDLSALFDGKIDDIRIYNRALSAEEIEELYEEGSNDLIAHWKLDEDSGTIAYDSAGDNDGNVNGATWACGIIDGALDFNGVGENMVVPDDDSLDITGAMTISTWLKLDGDVSQIHNLVGKISNDGWYIYGGYRLLFDNREIYTDGTCRLVFQKSNGVGGTGSGNYGTNTNWDRVVSETNTWETGVWYHFVATWDGTIDSNGMKMYINGVLDASHTAGQGTIKTNSYDLRISGSIDGKFDDIRIYGRALSAEEVEELYLEGAGAYAHAVNNIKEAIEEKQEALIRIDAAIAKEEAAIDALEELRESGDYGDLSKRDIIGALMKVHQAVQSEKQSLHFIDKSVESLEGSLADLGWEPNLIAYWKLDEGGGDTAYDSAGDNDGDVHGATWTSGIINGALDFDGENDYVEIGDQPEFNFGSDTDFSVCAWVKPAGDVTTVRIVDKMIAGHNPCTGFEMRTRAGHVMVGMKDNEGDRVEVTAVSGLVSGVWQSVAAVADRYGNLEVYYNGNLEDSHSLASVDNINIGIPLAIGRSMDYDGQYFDGLMDDVRIYNTALPAKEIRRIYHKSKCKWRCAGR